MNLLRLAFGVIALALATCSVASAQYPTRPVRLVVGFAAGGPTDILARRMAQYLSEKLGQQFIVENKPGATGNVATEYVLNAPPDGYTILVTSTANAINMTFYSKLSFDFLRDAQPVAGLASISYMMLLNPGVPAKTVPEFIAYAKANPGKLNYASQGNGTTSHLTGAMFDAATGTKMNHVPYRGTAPAINDLLGGHVDLMFNELATSVELHKGGRAKLLAVTTEKRIDELPDVPTMQEQGVPNFISDTWNAISAPPKTPAAIVAKLNAGINEVLKQPDTAEHLRGMNMTPIGGAPDGIKAFIKDETERWGDVIRAANIRAD